MAELYKKLRDLYLNRVWRLDIRSLSPLHRIAVISLRLVHNMTVELAEGHLTLRAMSLVYTTLLSLVPLLAVSFSLLKAFGVHNQVEPMLSHFLEPLGDMGLEFSRRVVGFVENIRVKALGSLGLILLIYTAISLVQKIEEAFNFIWQVRQPRRFVRRFSDYMSVLLIGPVLIFAAMGTTAAVMGSGTIQGLVSAEPFAMLFHFASHLVPYVLVCVAFIFVYLFIPNTKVNFSSALIGGLVAGILWETGGWGFAAFITSSTRYTAIYSGFAILIVFMIWLYVSWLILLFGALIAYYHQHPTLLSARRGEWRLGNEAREQAGILIMSMVGYNFYYQQEWWSLEALARRLNTPSLSLQPILEILENHGFLRKSGEDPARFSPARDIDTISLLSVIEAIRHAEAPPLAANQQLPEVKLVGEIMQRMDGAISATLAQQTIRDLVLAQAPPKAG